MSNWALWANTMRPRRSEAISGQNAGNSGLSSTSSGRMPWMATHPGAKRIGRTSVTYRVEVFRRQMDACDEIGVFTTDITFVRVDESGEKMPIREE